MFWLLMAMSILTGVLLQAHLPGIPVLGGIRPPLLAGLVLYYALNHRIAAGWMAALAAGLLLDALSLVPPGYSVLLFLGLAGVADRYRKLVLPEATVTAVFFGGLAGLSYSMVLYGLLVRSGMEPGHPVQVTMRIAGSGLTGLVTTPVVFRVMTILHKALDLADKEDNGRVNA